MSPKGHVRVSIGFAGGQVLAVRVATDALERLNTALGTPAAWFDLELDDGAVRISLAQIAYVRVDSDAATVGFGA
ncbi:MAG TPA: hypothetical protein VNC12_02065 [Solirubrobacteraceae bacterium]|nr:hypothetical protein [Solirubrobacteraceae bacterium]